MRHLFESKNQNNVSLTFRCGNRNKQTDLPIVSNVDESVLLAGFAESSGYQTLVGTTDFSRCSQNKELFMREIAF